MIFDKDKPYVVRFWRCSKKRTAALLSQQFNIQLTVVEMISARTLGGLQRLIARKCEDRRTQGAGATDIVLDRLKALFPDGERLSASTRLRDIEGFHYARLTQLIWREYDWRVPQATRISKILSDSLVYVMIFLAIYGRSEWIEPITEKLGQPQVFFTYLAFFATLAVVMFGLGVMQNQINDHWPRRYPAGVETMGQLATYLAGMNQGILFREGSAFDGDAIWSGIVGIFAHYHRIPVQRITPETGWHVKKRLRP